MASEKHKSPFLRQVIVLVLLALPLLVTASAIEAAEWVDGLPSLKALVVVSLVMWSLLARSEIPAWAGHLTALVGGLAGAFLLSAFTLDDVSGMGDLVRRLGNWFGAIGSREGDRGASAMGVLLLVVTLLMGHFSAWLAYRHSHALLAALPGLAALLVVLTFLPSDYYWYFFMYLLAAAPGVAYRHNGRWSMGGQRVNLAGALVAGTVLMSLTVAAVWKAPAPEGTVIPLASAVEKPWYSFQDRVSDLLHGVPSRHKWQFFAPPHELPFTGPIEPGDDLLYEVESEKPYRWRMRVYETYTRSGWTSHEDMVETPFSEVSLSDHVEGLKSRKEVTIATRIFSKSNALLTVGEPLDTRLRAAVELSPQPAFHMLLQGPQVGYLPPEVAEYRAGLLALQTDSGTQAPSADPDVLRDMGFRLTDASQASLTSQILDRPEIVLERIESNPGSPLAFLSRRVLVPPYRYETVGSISTATPSMLRNAGTSYPQHVTDRHLQLPNDFPETVRKLAKELAREQGNPYDKAEAIRRHLLSLPYNLEITIPEPGKDWVEHFLLVERSGYCQYYASAMITMLRTLGIPARLVVGFAPGILDEKRDRWIVQANHYHAWPEIYFPEYGWVEFEPTPANVQPALQELGFQREPVPGSDPFDIDECLLILGPAACPELIPPSGEFDPSLLENLPEPEEAPPPAGEVGGGGLAIVYSPWTLLAIAIAVVTLMPMAVVAYVRWRTVKLGYPTTIYAAMCFLGKLARVGRRPEETPWEHCSRLSSEFPDHAGAITSITRGFVISRYGPVKEPPAAEIAEIRGVWPSVRNALLRRISLRSRPRANEGTAMGNAEPS